MANICPTEDGYQRKIRMHGFMILICGAFVYMCILIIVLFHNSSTEQPLKESQIVDFMPGISPTMYSPGFLLEPNSYKESGDKSTYTNISSKENGLSNERIVISSSNYKHQDNRTSMTRSGKIRKWDKSHTLVFLHMIKSGGTSFDATMLEICKSIRASYIGRRHFDWSYIDTVQKPDVLVLLREPVARAVSHFHYNRRIRTFNRNGNISDYLRTPQTILEARDFWQDGQAAVMWLTGTHIAHWVGGIEFNQIEAREIQSLDHKAICALAADRLKQTLWFGFISDQERSLEMLQWQLGYNTTIKLLWRNITPHQNITLDDRKILESLMPMDLWLYNYAKLLFEARWQQYKTGIYREPELPTFPEMNCKSTRHILACNKKSPLGPSYHTWNFPEIVCNSPHHILLCRKKSPFGFWPHILNVSEEILMRQMNILPKYGWI